MKKIVLSLSVVLLTLIVVQSCKKDDFIDSNENDYNYKYKPIVNNGMLVFESIKDLEETINILSKSEKELENFENYLSFNSTRKVKSLNEREKLGIEDDLLATLINEKGEIQIENYVLKLDIPKETCYVIEINDYIQNGYKYNKQNASEYSIYDDFDNIVKGYSDGKSTYCSRNKKGPYAVSVGNWDVFKYKIVYQNALFYHSLIAKIKLNQDSGVPLAGDPFCYLKTIGDNYYRNNSNSNDPHDSDYKTHFGTNGYIYDEQFKAAYRPYESTKRLKSYRFSVLFSATFASSIYDIDNDPSTVSRRLTITCHHSSGNGGGGGGSAFGGAGHIIQ